MNTPPSNHESEAWAYVHGQMEPAEMAAFERRMQEEPELRAQVEGLDAWHRELRDLASFEDAGDPALEEEILEAWESDQQTRIRPGATGAPVQQLHLMIIPVLRFALAMAACLVLGVGLFNVSMPGLDWQGAARPAKQRGPEAGPGYTMAQLNGWLDAANSAIASAYQEQSGASRRSWFTRKRSWNLRAGLVERVDGSLFLEVKATRTTPARAEDTWEATYENGDKLVADLPYLSEQIATDLVRTESGQP